MINLRNIKRIIAVFITLVMFLCCFVGCSNNRDNVTIVEVELTAKEGESANGFLWENNFSEITITGYEGASNDLVLPSKINGKPVTLIKKNAFKGFTGLKSLKIPGCIKTIDEAFVDCTALESVELGDGIESMSYAFYGCSALKSVSVPGSVQKMTCAFEDCTSLASVTLAEGITDLENAFESCSSLESISVPSTVTVMDKAFMYCRSLKNVTFSEQIAITSLRYTFAGCRSLETVIIPETVTDIMYAFQGCTALKSINLHEGISNIQYAFSGCTLLTEIQIPTSVIYAYDAFDGCSSLKKVSTFGTPSTADESIYGSSDMFNKCVALEELDLTGLGSFQDFSLAGLVSLKKLVFDEQLDLDLLSWSHDPVESSIKTVTSAPDNVYKNLMNTDISRGYSYAGTVTVNGVKYDCVVKGSYGLGVKDYWFEDIVDNGRSMLKTNYFLGAVSASWKEVICSTYKYIQVVHIEVVPLVDEYGYYIRNDEGEYVFPELKNQEIEINGVVYPLEVIRNY